MRNQQFFCQLIVLLCFCSFIPQAHAQQAYTIFNKQGEQVSFEHVMKESAGKSHIFFGEYHNNPIAHWLQLEMTKQLYLTQGSNLVIGAEMFESDNQLLINEYFADQIKQKSFEEEARVWKNYKTDYKPIVEFAKKNNLKFIATNIPRRYANAVFYNGITILEQLTATAKTFIAPLPIRIDTALSSYVEISKMGGEHNGEFMMEAQAVKDATMAHFILANSTESTVFLHLNGAYHSNKYQGIIHFLQAEIQDDKILTLSTVSQDDISHLDEKNKQLADFTICVNSAMTLTH